MCLNYSTYKQNLLLPSLQKFLTHNIPYEPYLSELAVRATGMWNLRACQGLNQYAPLQIGGQLPTWEEDWVQ